MSNSILEQKWKRWYPKKIFLKNIKNHKKILLDSDKLQKEDFLIDLENQKNRIINKSEFKIDLTKTKAYEIGFKNGFLQGKKDDVLLNKKLNSLFLNFENSLSIFENALCFQALKIVLKISSYVIGKKIHFDESILTNYIKKIINKDGLFLKKAQIIIHSSNKRLIEKTFKEFLNTYKWTVIVDDSIDLNGCKIKSESIDIDATVDARWQEVCRLLYSEEY